MNGKIEFYFQNNKTWIERELIIQVQDQYENNLRVNSSNF